jgi:hypothetical protein
VSVIPRHLARRLDGLSRVAHRFHRFAHHPLCDDYAGEVVRIGRRGRVCRGCICAALGAPVGMTVSLVSSVPIGAGAVLFLIASSWIAVTTLLRIGPRRTKLVTRFAPAWAVGFAVGEGVRAGGLYGATLASLAVLACAAFAALYRRRGPDRTPCARCPERILLTPCRGFAEIVKRERAFQRLAGRMLSGVRPGPSLDISESRRRPSAG